MAIGTWVETLKERRRSATRPFLLGELFIVFLLLEVYDYIKSLEEVRMGAALRHGLDVYSLEHTLHLNIELSVN